MRMAEAIARGWARIDDALARRRVPLGFACGVAVLALARPTAASIAAGMSMAVLGEALRFWAAGHLNKSREVTVSGPYRWTAHPLYMGSSIMGAGLAVSCASVAAAIVIAAYLATTLTAAIRREESFLRATFGVAYDRYRRAASTDRSAAHRRFSTAQAIANGEHRTVLGLAAALLLLFLKATYNGVF